MLILLTNDDGILAPGIHALRKAVEQLADVIVVAPDRERSASGHGITMHKPLRVEKHTFGQAEGYAVSGTPADCVKLALEQLLPRHPDLVISGINRGSNLGTDTLYSGTVSGALEAIINGIPAIAVSLAYRNKGNYHVAAEFASKMASVLIKNPLPNNTLVNINVPDLDKKDIKGIKVARLGLRRYINCVEERKDPRGRSYYWLSGELQDSLEPETDIWAVAHDYISLTPVHYDLTNYSILPNLQKLEQLDW